MHSDKENILNNDKNYNKISKESELFASSDSFRLLFNNIPNSFAYYKAICDSTDSPIDFVFLEVNSAFEYENGLVAENIIGKSVLDTIPDISSDWFLKCGIVALTSKPNKMELYSRRLCKWQELSIFSPQKYHFAILTSDIPDKREDNKDFSNEENKVIDWAGKYNRDKFRAIFEQAKVGICLLNINGSFFNPNKMYCDIVGYSYEELIKLTYMDITHPSDLLECQIQYSRLNSGPENSFNIEKRYIKKNGEVIWVDITCVLVKDDYAAPQYYIVTIQDINAKKIAELELLKSGGRLQKAQIIANVGNWELNLSNNQVWASESALKIYGIEQNDSMLTLEQFQKVVCLEDRKKLYSAQKNLLENNTSYDFEYSIVKMNDWKKRVIHAIGVLEFDENKKPTKIIGTIQDVTDRKRVENQAKLSERKFRAIFDQAMIGISTVGIDGRYINPNNRFCEILGYSLEELTKMTYIQITHSDDINKSIIERSNVMNDSQNHIVMEKRLIKKNGDIIWVNLTSVLIRNPNGGNKYFITTIQDITDRKKAEHALKQSEQKYAAIFNQSPVAIEFYDAKGVYINGNDASLELFGISDKNDNLQFNLFDDEGINSHDKAHLLNMQTIKYQSTYDFDIQRFYFNFYDTDKTGFIIVDTVVIPIIIENRIVGYVKQMQEVTERELALKALEESERRYAAIYNQSPIAIEFYDTKGEIISENEACLNMFGMLDASENRKYNLFNEQGLDSVLQYQLLKKHMVRYQTTYDFDGARACNLYKTTKKGKIRVDATVIPIIINNKVAGYVKQMQDITEIWNYNKALKESERKYAAIFNQSPIAIEYYDADGMYVNGNEASLKLFGMSDMKENLNTKILGNDEKNSYIKSQLLEKRTVKYQMHFDFDLARRLNLYTTTRTGVICVDIVIIPIIIDNIISGYVKQMQEVTESNSYKTVISDNTDKLRELINSTADMIAIIGDRCYKYISENVEQLLGWHVEELLGSRFIDKVHPDHRERVIDYFDNVVNTPGMSRTDIFLYQAKSGEYKLIESMATNLKRDESVRGILIKMRIINKL